MRAADSRAMPPRATAAMGQDVDRRDRHPGQPVEQRPQEGAAARADVEQPGHAEPAQRAEHAPHARQPRRPLEPVQAQPGLGAGRQRGRIVELEPPERAAGVGGGQGRVVRLLGHDRSSIADLRTLSPAAALARSGAGLAAAARWRTIVSCASS
jgi:hypothetical protein